MTREPNDPLSQRLFEAARREPPSEGAEGRALGAALREASANHAPGRAQRARWVFGLAAVGLAAGLLLLVQRKQIALPISAEPAHAAPNTPSAPGAPTPGAPSARATESPASTIREPLAVKPLANAAAASAQPAVAATLTDELSALKTASTALGAGDARAALAALDRYDRVLKGSRLRAEATVLRIQALANSGDAQAASTLAERFVEQNPDSPLSDRARSFIRQPGLGGN